MDSGECLQFGDDLCYLHGGFGGVFPKVEAYLEGCRLLQTIELTLTPEEGYGHYDAQKRIQQPLHSIPPEARAIGCVLEGEIGDNLALPFTVVDIDGDQVTLEGNHPWSGRNLHFAFEVLAIREASSAEQACGYPLY